ncbi:hypothetical protein C448_07814 [Halococcus morrhuae DSM 1307]|uniref:Uncharacterized protein n=1 Tax=Halococcus morrhuae DSM 1307 TaxID=931277 RepID=M0MKC0_HALMO|nr:hypothetical protein [Halococcus morrhuae]EMA45184.1 hypothetical protein C448_07814 [Halococcus morrhuae DSM 1307]
MYELSDVHLDDYTDESTNQRITCTDQEIRHINAEHEETSVETISIDEISEIRRDTDKSQTGFKRIGYAFAGFGLVFVFMSVPYLLAGAFNPIAGGAYLSAVLCWFGFWMFYRMERGTLDVLEIRVDDEWYRFFTKKEGTAFDEIVSRLPHNVVIRSAGPDQPSP